MSIEAPFATEQEAREAYYGSYSGGDGDTRPDDAGWGQLEDTDRLDGGWVLAYQERTDGSQIRWFVFQGADGGGLVFLNPGGSEETVAGDSTAAEWPSHPTESDAREAHEKWLEANPGVTDEDGADGWSAWERITSVPPWFIEGRQHTDGSEEYMIVGERDGANVYLAPEATIQSNPYVYEGADAVDAALAAYYDAVESGDMPEGERPTGQQPDTSQYPTGRSGGASGSAGGIIASISDNPVLLGGAALAGVFLVSRGGDQ